MGVKDISGLGDNLASTSSRSRTLYIARMNEGAFTEITKSMNPGSVKLQPQGGCCYVYSFMYTFLFAY